MKSIGPTKHQLNDHVLPVNTTVTTLVCDMEEEEELAVIDLQTMV
jgi:hypothetical protein